MQLLIRRFSRWAYSGDDRVVARWRRRRMDAFLEHVNPTPGARVIDLGGTQYMWEIFENDFEVTIVNLPGTDAHTDNTERFRFVDGDACDLSELFGDRSFDVVFSNSVVEHVGDANRQQEFAREVRRLAPAYWVQTPSDRFPIEAHTGVPYYWRLPHAIKRRMHRRWERNLPAWFEMIQNTTVLTRQEMCALFPEASVYTERLLGLEKSYSFYRPFPGNA